MANEKRLISYDVLIAHLDSCIEQGKGLFKSVCVAIKCFVEQMPTVDAVPAEQFNTLKSFVNGEWVDCKLLQEALGIDFATGLKVFDFSRTAEWNPAPLNGQKITTKFRIKNAVEVVHGRWEDIWGGKYDNQKIRCSVCNGKALYDTKKDELGTWVAAQQLTQFCPHCGAKMDGDGNA